MSEHELWNELGNLYFMSGSYNQAIYAYHRSIQLDSSFGRPYSNLALAYVQQGKYEEAIELYRSSIELLVDNKEKAISWSRLGNVYRHIKDYTKAVIAYQEADELDPLSTADILPRESPDNLPQTTGQLQPITKASVQTVENMSAGEEPAQRVDDVIEPVSIIGDEENSPEMVIEAQPGSFEKPEQALEQEEELVAKLPVNSTLSADMALSMEEEPELNTNFISTPLSLDDSTASWALADIPRYQEDISESPDTGSLTIWGEPDSPDEDWDLYPIPDPDPEVELSGSDGDGLSRWVPEPEEGSGNESGAFESAEETQEQMPVYNGDQPAALEVPETANIFQNSSTVATEPNAEFSPLNLEDGPEQMAATFPLALPYKSGAQWMEEYSGSTVQLLDVEVEERPAPVPTQFTPEFVLATQPEDTSLEDKTESNGIQSATREPERETQELKELEAGIAKFKRAVQTNPRNAYAWDALGTLYKSAGLYQEAILAFQQATVIDPNKALYYHNLGLVYACEGRDEEAIGAFQTVIEIDPDYSLAHATLGGYYRKMGQEELAQKHIGRAMKNIFDSENEYNRACLEAICGNIDHAIELLGVALRNKQTYVDWILRDPDLDFIRQDPRFKQLVADFTR